MISAMMEEPWLSGDEIAVYLAHQARHRLQVDRCQAITGSLAGCLWTAMAYGADGTDTMDIGGSQIPGDSPRTVKSTDPGI